MTSSTIGRPRKQHIATRAWVKRFAADEGKLYVYDWEKDQARESSSKPMMMIYERLKTGPEPASETGPPSQRFRRPLRPQV